MASILWMIFDFGYEPVISTLVLIAGLVGFIKTETPKEERAKTAQNQRGGNNSKNYQAGRDIKL
ncbi:hypothetical protein [Pontibacter virosus]|nr:hypothetical protein [Pontibacter virosus]